MQTPATLANFLMGAALAFMYCTLWPVPERRFGFVVVAILITGACVVPTVWERWI